MYEIDLSKKPSSENIPFDEALMKISDATCDEEIIDILARINSRNMDDDDNHALLCIAADIIDISICDLLGRISEMIDRYGCGPQYDENELDIMAEYDDKYGNDPFDEELM